MNNRQLLQWKKERDEAVSSLDLNKFKAFLTKWSKLGVYDLERLPSDGVLERSMYKMAYEITSINDDVKAKAEVWMIIHNCKPIDWSKE